MGLNVLEAAAEVGARLVSVSTVCIYPEHAPVPTPESCMHDGYPAPDTAPYGIAKKTLHVVAEAMRREFGLRHLTIVPTNLYGPGDHYDEAKSHVVPALIRRTHESKLAGAQELVVWGDGSAVRDLLYAPDCARGLRLALESDLSGECLNLGSGVGTSVRELAETICAVVGFRGMLRWDTTKPVGAPRRLLDASRARQLLGFEPATRLEQGLQRAYEDFLQRYQ
jgi:GDP-L-fucose synthase